MKSGKKTFFVEISCVDGDCAHSVLRHKTFPPTQTFSYLPQVKSEPGLPDGLFSNQNPGFGAFRMPFERKLSISFLIIRYTLWPFGLFHGNLVNVLAIR
jgi:hypothetical protein